MNKLMEVTGVSKVYRSAGESVRALSGISLSIYPADYIAVVGPSGAGKSTLLHILGGLDCPSSGWVKFKEKNIYQLKDKQLSFWRSRHVGFVFQFYHLIEELTVLENVTLPLGLNRKNYSLKTLQELLKYLDIQQRQNFYPSRLSGGEKQKTAIARALACDPEVILCDEPTGNLDEDSQGKVVQLLNKLNREKAKTIILVTHNLELAKQAKKVLFIKGGEISDTSAQ